MRLFLISNQTSKEGHAGFREAFSEMVSSGDLEAFEYVTPTVTARSSGQDVALAELMRRGREFRPGTVLVSAPRHFGHDADWIESFLSECGRPAVVCWEGDLFQRWIRPINESMRSWLAAADTVFSVAGKPQSSLFRAAGAKDVRLLPQTYCPVVFRHAEDVCPLDEAETRVDVVLIGTRLARWGLVSRTPGAVGRADLVRRLQRRQGIRLAVYGSRWSGRGAMGPLPFNEQTQAIRRGLVSANWDHFARHESYASNRLPISMIAGRVHVTTAHPKMDWLPDDVPGVHFVESPRAAVDRLEAILACPREEILAEGAAAHRWVCGRLSNREAARFMLGSVDARLLRGLPPMPWLHLADRWPGKNRSRPR